jgi:hypothetical protein
MVNHNREGGIQDFYGWLDGSGWHDGIHCHHAIMLCASYSAKSPDEPKFFDKTKWMRDPLDP